MNIRIFTLSPSLILYAAVLLAGGLNDALAQFYKGQCPTSGRQCNGCQLVDDCSEQNEVYAIQTSPVETCTGSEACDASKAVPKCEAGSTCRYKTFSCPPNLLKEEVFPDAYSCVEYHVCKDDHQTDYSCGPRQIFDPKKKTCADTENNGCLSTPVPLCEVAGTEGSLPDTDFMYTCMEEFTPYHVIYPQISLKSGEESAAGDSTTEQATSASSQPETSATTQQATSATSQPETPATTQQATSAASQPETSATTQQATSAASQPETSVTTQQATSATSQPETSATTQQATSAASQPETSTTTQVEVSTTSQPETSTTTPMPSTSSTTSTAPPSTTQKPFECDSVGYFAVPDDCHSYYICYQLPNNSLSFVERTCRSGSHFDAAEQRCLAGSCSNYHPSTSPGTTSSSTFICPSDGVFADRDCCKCYYICISSGGGQGVAHKCCRNGSHFDPSQKICRKPGTCSDCAGCPASANCYESAKLGPNNY